MAVLLYAQAIVSSSMPVPATRLQMVKRGDIPDNYRETAGSFSVDVADAAVVKASRISSM
ncbi:MAG: hypothetical protein IPM69_05705 [Ignavibacteria bacterium]|nr:hypothetical protein [Ignavibacteria bacterium]